MQVDQYVFARMLYEQRTLDDIHFQIYTALCKELVAPPLHGIIYMDTQPDICLKRIITRSRPSEKNLSIEYLQWCYTFYHEWLANETKGECELLTIQADVQATFNQHDPTDQGVVWVQQAKTFIESFQN
jgi:deoxyadenosine/deoxycytidine kinase